MRTRVVDVLVAGGGPAGATAARLLALKGRRVLLIDPASAPIPRLEVLPPAALGVVAAAGLSEALTDPILARPCLGIRRQWGRTGPEWEDFLAHRGGKGFVIDRAAFDAFLRQAAMAAGVEILVGRVTGAGRIDRNGAHRMVVETSCEACPHIVASVAIDATGRPAALARRLGADQAMKQRLIAELLPDGEHSRFADAMSGWLHIASERDSWTFALAGPQDTRQQWRIAPQRGGSPNVPRYCLDASPRQLSRAAGIAWLAVGDAALAFDPITSQGLFNALSTALIVTGILQADAVLSEETANDYSACIQAVASLSDASRKEVYASLL